MSSENKDTQSFPSWQEFQEELIARALKDQSFRQELLANPKSVVEKEMGKFKEGIKLPETMEIKVIEQPAEVLYIVLPVNADKVSEEPSEELSEEDLENVAGGVSVHLQVEPTPGDPEFWKKWSKPHRPERFRMGEEPDFRPPHRKGAI